MRGNDTKFCVQGLLVARPLESVVNYVGFFQFQFEFSQI